jgi:hypothetical protein
VLHPDELRHQHPGHQVDVSLLNSFTRSSSTSRIDETISCSLVTVFGLPLSLITAVSFPHSSSSRADPSLKQLFYTSAVF